MTKIALPPSCHPPTIIMNSCWEKNKSATDKRNYSFRKYHSYIVSSQIWRSGGMSFKWQNKECQEVTCLFSVQTHFKSVKERKTGFWNLPLAEQSLTQSGFKVTAGLIWRVSQSSFHVSSSFLWVKFASTSLSYRDRNSTPRLRSWILKGREVK